MSNIRFFETRFFEKCLIEIFSSTYITSNALINGMFN